MAAGQITSPTTWLLGSVVPPSWLQSVQDNVNNSLKNIGIIGAPSCTLTRGAAIGTGGVSGFFTNSSACDMGGSIAINTGSSTSTGTLGTVTLANTTLSTSVYPNGMTIFLSPLTALAAAATPYLYFVNSSSGGLWTSWTMNTQNPLSVSTAGGYIWNYFVIMT
jgi:hypothetical protein